MYDMTYSCHIVGLIMLSIILTTYNLALKVL
jgi:hypothetical protein